LTEELAVAIEKILIRRMREAEEEYRSLLRIRHPTPTDLAGGIISYRKMTAAQLRYRRHVEERTDLKIDRQ